MAHITLSYEQNLNQPVFVREPGACTFTGDNASTEIAVALVDDNGPAEVSGTVLGYAIRADGSTVALTGLLVENVASVTLPEACFVYPGPLAVSVQVVADGSKTTIFKAGYYVESTRTDTIIDPGSVVPDLSDILAMLDEMEQATEAANAAAEAVPAIIAPTFDTSTAYTVGDYVYYSGALYRFTADHAAGAWTGTDAVSVKLAPEVADLKSAVTEIVPNILDFHITIPTVWTSGKYVDPSSGNLANNSTYSYTGYMPVKANMIYELRKVSQCYGAFYTASLSYISGINRGDTGTGPFEYTVPSTGAYLRLSCPTADIASLDFSIKANKEIAPDILIPDVADALNDLNKIVPNVSEFNKLIGATWTSGKYVDPTTGNLANNSPYSYTDYVSVTANTEYVFSRKNNVYGAFYNADKEYLGQIMNEQQSSGAFTATSPANAKYMRLSCLTVNIQYADVSVNGVKELAPNIYISKYSHTITVSKDGTKDFTSLRTALESIVDSAINNTYLVEFYGDGTEYDADADYTATEISNNAKGLTIPPYTTLKGVGGKEKCIIAGRLTSSTTNRYFSTINLSGGASIEGFTVIGEYTRNVIHQDFGTLTNVDCVVKDCLLQGSNLNLAYVLAAGILSGCKYSYINTVFENQTSGGYAYSCHNNTGFADSAFLYFDNCRFKVASGTNDFSFRLGSINTNANGINCYCIMKGCKVPVQLRLNQESAQVYGAGILWKVSGYANDIADVHIYTSDGIDYSGNIDLLPMP